MEVGVRRAIWITRSDHLIIPPHHLRLDPLYCIKNPPLAVPDRQIPQLAAMSGNRHPDLDRFYEALEAEGGDGEYYPDPDDEDGDGDFDVYLDEIDEDDVDDDGMIVDVDVPSDEEDEEDDEDDDDFMIDVEEDDEDEGDGEIRLSGQTWLNLAELINSSRGSAGARSSLLAQLLAAPNVRAGGAGLRRMPEELPTDPVERARRLAERRRKERWWKPQSEPNPRGLQLLQSGEFGRVGPWRRATKGARVPVRHQQLRSRAQVSAVAAGTSLSGVSPHHTTTIRSLWAERAPAGRADPRRPCPTRTGLSLPPTHPSLMWASTQEKITPFSVSFPFSSP